MNNKVIRHFSIYLGSGILAKALPFIILLVIANYLTPSEFGLVNNFNIAVQLFVAIMTLKLGSLVQAEYYKASIQKKEKMVSNLIYLTVIISGILVLTILSFGDLFYNWLNLKYYWLLIAIFVAFSENIFNLRSVLLRLEEKPKIYAKYQILYSVAIAAFTILLVVLIPLAWRGRIWAMVISSVLVLILTFRYFYKINMLTKALNWQEIKRYLNFGLPLLPHSITPFLRSGIDKILITSSIGLAANGLYSFGATLSSVFIMLQVAFFSAYTPRLYKKLASFETSNIKVKQIKLELLSEGYIAMAIMILVLIIGYFGVRGLFLVGINSEYEKSLEYLPWFLINVFWLALFQLFSSYVIYSNHTKLLGFSMFSAGVLQAVLSYRLIKDFGVYGALYAMVIGGGLRVIITFFLANKYYPMPWTSALLHVFENIRTIRYSK